MKIEGIIYDIFETETFGNFQKRGLVIETAEQYPQKILIEFHQDRIDLIDNYAVGMKVSISINLRGREWESPDGNVRYFNTIVGWRIENIGQAAPEKEPLPEPVKYPENEDESDMPF